jgi:mycothiol system anti-sigma-R factor
MSCGDHHETDCSEVLAEVWLYLDQECDCERRKLLQHHLDECRPCLEQYGISVQLKALLARKCGGEQAPLELRQRLRDSIQALIVGTAAVADEFREGSDAAIEVVVETVEVGVEASAHLEPGERLAEREG